MNIGTRTSHPADRAELDDDALLDPAARLLVGLAGAPEPP